LLRSGRWYDRAWVGDLLSMTPASHAVIGTGSFPKDDGGIVNWNWTTGSKISPSMQSLASFQSGWAFGVMKQSGTPTLAESIRKAYPRSTVIAGSGSHFHAAGPMGGPAASWIFSYQRQKGVWAPYTVGQRAVPTRLLQDPALRTRLLSSNGNTVPLLYEPLPLGQEDSLVSDFAVKALQNYRPRAIMINLPEPDTIGHWSQNWRAEEAVLYRAFDRDLGNIIEAYKRAGIFKQTLFAITADHGMAQSRSRVFDLGALENVLNAQHDPALLSNGVGTDTMMALWMNDASRRLRVAKAIYAAHLDNVSAVFALEQTGHSYRYRMVGCEQCSPALVAAYRYLMETEAGPTGEGIAILFRENARRSGLKAMTGRHGGADWASQQVTLLLSGPGVRHGVSHHPARLVDLTPTIERFMGITPDARDGVVLADAFTTPSRTDVATQRRSDVVLGAYDNALRDRAASDTALEAAGRLPNSTPADELGLAPNAPSWQVFLVESIDSMTSLLGAWEPAFLLAIPVVAWALWRRRKHRPGSREQKPADARLPTGSK
ncbi:MAG TPA: alkaline phosphatase family protein, partial [Chloroflexota bacterium]